MELSNSQITKLGDRLRNDCTKDDLGMLDGFRQTFSKVDEAAYTIIKQVLPTSKECTITKRKRKTQQSIVDKLRRQKNLRLAQMQDIAGCRIVLNSGIEQANEIKSVLVNALREPWQVESKERVENGYRAIHIIAKLDKKCYEIQLRTYAQDIWANLVESMSDEKNTLKYGGSEQEQPLMKKLIKLAESFRVIDQKAHENNIEQYQQQIKGAINHVLSH